MTSACFVSSFSATSRLLPVHCLNEQTIRRAHRQVEFESVVYPQARAAQFRYRLYVRAPRHEQRWSKSL